MMYVYLCTCVGCQDVCMYVSGLFSRSEPDRYFFVCRGRKTRKVAVWLCETMSGQDVQCVGLQDRP